MKTKILFICVFFLVISGCAAKSPLIRASEEGNVITTEKLIKEGADVNEQDSNGYTPLMHAIFSEKTETVKVLISKGADVNAKDKNGHTPLLWAIRGGDTYVAKQLIESGADVNIKDKNGFDALLSAVNYNQIELLNILLDNGANIESRDYYGDTPLAHAALRKMNIDAVKILAKRGANANTRNKTSKSLFELLLDEPASGMMNIVAVLINTDPNLLKPTKDRARLFFFGEKFARMGTVSVNVGDAVKYLSRVNTFNFIDVAPGNHIIAIKISAAGSPTFLRKTTNYPINVKADKAYYLKILQREDFSSAGLIGELIGQTIIGQGVSAAADQIEVPFRIGLIEESVAKGNIKEIFKLKEMTEVTESNISNTHQTTTSNIPKLTTNPAVMKNSPEHSGYAQKLRDLKKLKDEELITDEEYAQKRKAIVDGI